MNGKKISVSDSDRFENSYNSIGGKGLEKVKQNLYSRGVKNFWFYSFAYSGALVANGSFLASVIKLGTPWDAAAISLIVEEAGGKATDIKGNRRLYNEWGDGILVTNGNVHDEILSLIDHEDTRD